MQGDSRKQNSTQRGGKIAAVRNAKNCKRANGNVGRSKHETTHSHRRMKDKRNHNSGNG